MGNWTPSIVPSGDGETVYLVLDDFGDLGHCWRETDTETAADLETVISDLLKGEYANPVRVISFNTVEGGPGIFLRILPMKSGGAAISG